MDPEQDSRHLHVYVNTTLDLPLVSMFASDKEPHRQIRRLLCIFTRDEGNLLITEDGRGSDENGDTVHQCHGSGAATYEREIKRSLWYRSQWGIRIQRGLCFISNWPSENSLSERV